MGSAGLHLETRVVQVDDETVVTSEILLGRLANGDTTAFGILYQRFSPIVYGMACRLLLDGAHAEEVTQEVFLELWQSAHRFDAAVGSGHSWICRLTHSRAVDRIRAVQRSKVRDTHYNASELRRSAPSAADVVIGRLEGCRIREALGVCTTVQRQAIELAYFGGYTYRQVSEILGIPCCTAKTRIRDGMIRLRDHLEASA